MGRRNRDLIPVGPVSVYCDGVGCHVLYVRHGIPLWQHFCQSTTATSRHRLDMFKSDLSPTIKKKHFYAKNMYFVRLKNLFNCLSIKPHFLMRLKNRMTELDLSMIMSHTLDTLDMLALSQSMCWSNRTWDHAMPGNRLAAQRLKWFGFLEI